VTPEWVVIGALWLVLACCVLRGWYLMRQEDEWRSEAYRRIGEARAEDGRAKFEAMRERIWQGVQDSIEADALITSTGCRVPNEHE